MSGVSRRGHGTPVSQEGQESAEMELDTKLEEEHPLDSGQSCEDSGQIEKVWGLPITR